MWLLLWRCVPQVDSIWQVGAIKPLCRGRENCAFGPQCPCRRCRISDDNKDLLLDCYTTEATRALVLATSGVGEKETVSLLAINADEQETEELIDTLCVFRKLDFQDHAPVLN